MVVGTARTLYLKEKMEKLIKKREKLNKFKILVNKRRACSPPAWITAPPPPDPFSVLLSLFRKGMLQLLEQDRAKEFSE